MHTDKYILDNFILVSPWSKPLRIPGKEDQNPKNYPWWPELLMSLVNAGNHIVQIGMDGERQLVEDFRKNLPWAEVKKLLEACRYFMSVDNFLPHFAYSCGIRSKGIVLWGMSDPIIYGYPDNLNLLKDRKYLRHRPFGLWEEETANPNVFLTPDQVLLEMSQHARCGP
jgi:hypothetical protein